MTEIPSPLEDEELFDQIDWALASEEALRRVWDNEYDAVYDNWRELYGVDTEDNAAQHECNDGSASPA